MRDDENPAEIMWLAARKKGKEYPVVNRQHKRTS